jgi:Trk K+ transport system NAD-binding subunit
MIQLKGAAWGWNNQILYKQADVAIERGMRMVVLGEARALKRARKRDP